MSSIDRLMEDDMDLRVLWIAGEDNPVADALSRNKNAYAVSICPGLRIESFVPPRLTLGAAKK